MVACDTDSAAEDAHNGDNHCDGDEEADDEAEHEREQQRVLDALRPDSDDGADDLSDEIGGLVVQGHGIFAMTQVSNDGWVSTQACSLHNGCVPTCIERTHALNAEILSLLHFGPHAVLLIRFRRGWKTRCPRCARKQEGCQR